LVGQAALGLPAILAALAVYQHRIGVAIAIGLLIAFAITLGLEGTATATRLAIRAVNELGQRIESEERR
jgi:regulator of sirC expression with transglutaminase-like and TPR domain